jgi:hypothetical protein
MSLYAELRKTTPNVHDCFDGNLCRCTGYRPILEAADRLVEMRGSHCENDCESCPKKAECEVQRIYLQISDIEDTPSYLALEFPNELRDYYNSQKNLESYIFKRGGNLWARPTTKLEMLALKVFTADIE